MRGYPRSVQTRLPPSSRPAPGLDDLLHSIGLVDGLAIFASGPHRTTLTWGRGPTVSDPDHWPQDLRALRKSGPVRHGLNSGVVGWIGYEAGAAVERMPTVTGSRAGDLVRLWRVEGSLIHDARTGHWELRGDSSFQQEARALLARAQAAPALDLSAETSPTASPRQREQYVRSVESALQAIRQGRVYQVNLAWPMRLPCPDPVAAWRALRQHNPAWRTALMHRGGTTLVSNSPECFLQGGRREGLLEVRSSPIKGTVPHSAGAAGRRHLLDSPKERAELTMIVDLVRNDLGRVAVPGTVAPSTRELRTCGDLLHAEQHVRATLQPDADVVDLLAATFPPGSVTGAPKVEAMSLIAELEPAPRGPYTGTLGFIGDNDEVELAVAIRTAVVREGMATCHVGAGIVADSDPDREWEETLAKAGALARLVGARHADT